MPSTRNTTQVSADCRAAADSGEVPRQHSSDLMQGGRRMVIEHGGELYCLRVTRNERLILTKV